MAGSTGRGGCRLKPYQRPSRGVLSGPSPVDCTRTGSKNRPLVDAAGVPLAVTLTGGNCIDTTQLLPLVHGFMLVAERNGITAKRARYPLMS